MEKGVIKEFSHEIWRLTFRGRRIGDLGLCVKNEGDPRETWLEIRTP
jgi:hypothetical protein